MKSKFWRRPRGGARVCSALAFAAVSVGGLAVCDAAAGTADDAWHFEATPYLWAASLQGDVGVGRMSPSDIDASFSDLLKSLSFGFMGSFEARKDNFGYFADINYIHLTETTPTDLQGVGDVRSAITQQVYTLAGTWRVLDAATQVDLFGGARFNDIKADLQLYPGAVNPDGRRTVQSRDWVDGFVGARARYEFAPGWSAVGYADLGAGGSKFTWQALAGLNYSISPRFEAKFGYRYLKTDYNSDGFLYDVGNGGFFLGLGIRF